MTIIHIDLRESDFTTNVRAALLFTPTRRVIEDDYIVLPRPLTVEHVENTVDVEIQPTGASWVWKVEERIGGGTTRYVAVPDSLTPINYEDLVEVDPTTLAPVPEPAVATWLDAATSALIDNPTSTTSGSVDAKTATVALSEDPADEGTYLIGGIEEPYKPVGVDADSLFPPRVEARLASSMGYVRPSGDATGVTDSAALAAALSSSDIVEMRPGQWYIHEPITLASNKHLRLTGPINLLLVAGSNCNIITNQIGVETTTNIAVVATGDVVLDGNGGNQTRLDPGPDYAGWRNVGLLFVNVDGLKVSGVTWRNVALFGAFMTGVRNAEWYSCSINAVSQAEGGKPNQDGLDVGPGCSNIIISNFHGNAGDDAHSVFAKYTTSNRVVHPLYVPDTYPYKTGSAYWTGPAGALYSAAGNDTHHVHIMDTVVDTAQQVLRMQAAEGSKLHHIYVNNVRTTADQADGLMVLGTMNPAYITGSLPAADGSDFHDIYVDRIGGNANWLLKLDSYIRSVKITNVDIENWQYLVARSDTNGIPKAFDLTIDGVTSSTTGTGGSAIVLIPGMELVNLTMRNVRVAAVHRVISNTSAILRNLVLEMHADTVTNATPMYRSTAVENTGIVKVTTESTIANWGLPPTLPSGLTVYPNEVTAFRDTFTRADADTLGSAESGGVWVALASSNYYGSIIGNAAAPRDGTSGSSYMVQQTTSASGVVTATFSAIGNGYTGIVVRATDTNNAIDVQCRVNSSDLHYRLGKRVAGVYTQLAVSANTTSADGDVVQVVMQGAQISVYVNGVEAIPPTTVPEFIDGTQHGIMLPAGNLAARVADVSFVS